MKMNVDTKELLEALNRVSPCINPRHLTPIVQCFHIRIEKESGFITGTDYEKTATTQVNLLDSDFEGAFCVDHKLLSGIVRNSVANKVGFEIDQENSLVHIEMDRSNYKLPLEDAKLYPTVSHTDPKEELDIEGGIFFEALLEAKRHTNDDDLRQFFNVHIKGGDGVVKIQATDTFGAYNHIVAETKSEFSLLLPKQCVSFFETTTLNNAELKLGYTDNVLVVKDDKTVVSMTLTDASYPNLDGVLPKEEPTTVFSCDRTAFLNAMGRLSVVYGQMKEKVVRLDISNEMMVVSTKDLALNSDGKEYIDGALQGDPLTIGFNAKYLVRMLQCHDSDEVKMNMTQHNRGLVLENEGKTLLVLPSLLVKVGLDD